MHESSDHAEHGLRLPAVRVPADWELQQRIWLAWPHNRNTWPGRFEPIPAFFRGLSHRIAESIPVAIIGDRESEKSAALSGPNFRWVSATTDDCWIRDYGPTFVANGQERQHAIDWRYNAWGGKYPSRNDDRVAEAILVSSGWQRMRSDLCLEGGALEHDGCGTLLTTSSCLLTETRNPNRSRFEIERELRQMMGCKEIVWVDGGGLAGDDTDGHIDQLVRFVGPESIVVASCDRDDENFAALDANHQTVEDWSTRRSVSVEVVRLPIPPARHLDGQRVPESYCNFLRLGPDRLLVPEFGNKASDDRAAGILKELGRETFPQLEVESVDCRDLAWGLGALHCATCNEPMLGNLQRTDADRTGE
ncbi:MAG: agmatine deiminase family protein [Planctomycetota bacterium]